MQVMVYRSNTITTTLLNIIICDTFIKYNYFDIIFCIKEFINILNVNKKSLSTDGKIKNRID